VSTPPKANRVAFACRLPAETLATIKREAAGKGISEANVIVGWAVAAECHVYVVDTTGIDASKLRNAVGASAGLRIDTAPLEHASASLKACTMLAKRRAGAAPIKRPGEK
jgi:hypothetical protein